MEIQVEYPARFRYKAISSLDVSVKNTSDWPLPALVVAFDRAYLSRFSQVQFTPSPHAVTPADYQVRIDNIPPGEARSVSVSLQAERYGPHRGDVRVFAESGLDIRIPVNTFVFP